MANEEVLGPRKTMFVLVIVVGCFAVLWPRILSPLLLGPSREQLKPNQFDREAGCCEVIFEKDMAILELINEVCSSVTHLDKISPYSAAECRKAVNDTCGVDIAAFLKRSDNVGKTSKMLVEIMKNSNSSCLKEHFGVPVWNLGPHLILNSWTQQDTIKQERPPIRGAGPHPALRERGRAIPPGVPAAPVRSPVAMPPHARVRSSPLSVYYELDIKPPPIPGMRPPLGSPGGPVPTPKSSMGFVMPIYTICIIVFFVYTLSKIMFKRTGPSPYEVITPDPQFRRRVFRDDSRTSPDKLVVTAISGLVAEVQQQMEASYALNQQRQDDQNNQTRPYTNGTVLHNSGPVHIVASEYREQAKDKSPEPQPDKEASPAPETLSETNETVEEFVEKKEPSVDLEEIPKEAKESNEFAQDDSESANKSSPEPVVERESTPEEIIEREITPEVEEPKEPTPESEERLSATKSDVEEEEEAEEDIVIDEIDGEDDVLVDKDEELEPIKSQEIQETIEDTETNVNDAVDLIEEAKYLEEKGDKRSTEEFLREELNAIVEDKEKQSTPELLEEAIQEEEDEIDHEKSTVKVVGMEVSAQTADGSVVAPPLPPPPPREAQRLPPPRVHEAESVMSIFLETEIPQQSRVLVADFVEDHNDKPQLTKHSPMVVSGKMTLSLIQDAPRETPERDQESTIDDFTTASAVTQNAAEKDGEESEEEIEEEIEIEEIEEEIEEVEEENEEELEPKQKESRK